MVKMTLMLVSDKFYFYLLFTPLSNSCKGSRVTAFASVEIFELQRSSESLVRPFNMDKQKQFEYRPVAIPGVAGSFTELADILIEYYLQERSRALIISSGAVIQFSRDPVIYGSRERGGR